MTHGKFTWKQRYYLALICYVPAFGLLFAVAAVLIVASNFALPRAEMSGDPAEIVIIGAAFSALGCAIYLWQAESCDGIGANYHSASCKRPLPTPRETKQQQFGLGQ